MNLIRATIDLAQRSLANPSTNNKWPWVSHCTSRLHGDDGWRPLLHNSLAMISAGRRCCCCCRCFTVVVVVLSAGNCRPVSLTLASQPASQLLHLCSDSNAPRWSIWLVNQIVIIIIYRTDYTWYWIGSLDDKQTSHCLRWLTDYPTGSWWLLLDGRYPAARPNSPLLGLTDRCLVWLTACHWPIAACVDTVALVCHYSSRRTNTLHLRRTNFEPTPNQPTTDKQRKNSVQSHCREPYLGANSRPIWAQYEPNTSHCDSCGSGQLWHEWVRCAQKHNAYR